MKLYIKNMVSNRCKIIVKEILNEFDLDYVIVDFGEVDIMQDISENQREELRSLLSESGLELMDNKKSVLIEKIKNIIIEIVNSSNEVDKINFSHYLSQKVSHNYNYIANLFSETQGVTIEQYIISHKIERIKELIIYGELNISEIARKMNYSSVAHLSSQFKKITGLSPSHFRQLKETRRNPLEDIGQSTIENLQYLNIQDQDCRNSYARSLLDAFPDPIIVIDVNHKITECNSAFKEISNKKFVDIIGTNGYDYFTNPEKAKEFCEKVIEDKSINNEKLRFLNHNDNDVLMNRLILKNAEQKVIGSILVARNISIQKTNNKRFQSFVESIPDAIVIVDKQGNIQSVNKQTEEMFGYDRSEIIGNKIELLMPSRFKEAHPGHRDGFVSHPKTRKMGEGMQLFAQRKNGNEFPVEISLSKIEVEDGFMVCSSIRDITNQKRIENVLNEAILKAENAVISKQKFLSNMSHEIRTPMNAIIGFTKVILKTELNPKQKEYLNAIKMSGDTLIVLINDILDLAKVDSGKMVFEKIPFKLSLSINTMLHLFETKIQEKNLKLNVKYDQNIPEILLGDPTRLHQIILNLVGNAIKFTNEGKITVSVRKLAEYDDNITIEFLISDTGIGIEDNKIDGIFEDFQQAHNQTSRIYGGTGLGLAIVKKLVEAQGGSIRVESEIDRGSTISFVLNFKKADGETYLENELTELVDEDIKNAKVLVVEDVEFNQMLISTLLNDFGFECDIVENGKLAIEKLENNQYDIVLMDLQMPVMNGFQTTDYIRNTLKSDISIIALTADVTTVDLQKCIALGMNDYISKPLDEKKLYNKIVSLIKNPNQKISYNVQEKSDQQTLKHIDIDAVNKITNANAKMTSDMINIYLKQTPTLVNTMKLSLEKKDWSLLKAVVHKMIPSFSIMIMKDEAENIAKNIQEMDEQINSNEELNNLVLKLASICTLACNEIEIKFKK